MFLRPTLCLFLAPPIFATFSAPMLGVHETLHLLKRDQSKKEYKLCCKIVATFSTAIDIKARVSCLNCSATSLLQLANT